MMSSATFWGHSLRQKNLSPSYEGKGERSHLADEEDDAWLCVDFVVSRGGDESMVADNMGK